jgi:hypothetical protein
LSRSGSIDFVRPSRVFGPAAVVVVIACHGATAPTNGDLGHRVDRAARACAKATSCARPHDVARDRDPAACVDAWLARSPAELDRVTTCVAEARGCESVEGCLRTPGDSVAAAYCGQNAGTRTGCDGQRLVTCAVDDAAESKSIDCAALGARCAEWKQPGGLVSHACLSASVCPPSAPELRCEGAGGIVACRDGAVERTPCGEGSHCKELHAADGSTSAVCELSEDRHCDAVGKRWCEGGKVLSCQPHGPFGQVVASDCAALGMTCDDRSEPTGAECVVPGALACDRGAPRCDGASLAFCAAGRRERVPCSEIGFVTCDPDAHGVDAACTLAQAPAASSRP